MVAVESIYPKLIYQLDFNIFAVKYLLSKYVFEVKCELLIIMNSY